MSEPKYVAETLAWCNARRAEKGKKPLKKLPKGERGIGTSCPCGKATGLEVGLYRFRPIRGDESVGGRVPTPVRRFVVAFDNGRLPQYEAKR